MSSEALVEQSYKYYIQATVRFSAIPVEKKEYRDLLFSAVSALKDITELPRDEYPYVIVKIDKIYMKAKKIGENLDVSFMDKETFDLTTKYKQNLK